MKRILAVMLGFFSMSALAASLSEVPALIGGLDLPAVRQCVTIANSYCAHRLRPPKHFSCLKSVMKKRPICRQNLAFYRVTSGFIKKIKHYSAVDVIYSSVQSSSHSDEYYLVTRQGKVISPLSKIDISKADNYAAIKRQFPRVMLWPIVVDAPNAIKAKNGDEQFIFEQLLLNGCFSCERAGTAVVAYRFSPQGDYKGHQLVRLIIRT